MFFFNCFKEVFVDPSRDESIIIELLDFKHDVEDNGSAVWFLRDLASEQDAEQSMVCSVSLIVLESWSNYEVGFCVLKNCAFLRVDFFKADFMPIFF